MPSNKYYKYGCYKLYNQYGTHRVLNNQTGHAPTDGYKSSNCSTVIRPGGAPNASGAPPDTDRYSLLDRYS